MRVHELAKEFGMTSKELLDRLQAMKIPAKNHASTLIEPYVDKIRKELRPEIAERQAVVEAERAAKEAAEAAAKKAAQDKARAEAEARKAAEDAERKAAEAQRSARDAEQQAAEDAREAERKAVVDAEAAKAAEREAALERARANAAANARAGRAVPVAGEAGAEKPKPAKAKKAAAGKGKAGKVVAEAPAPAPSAEEVVVEDDRIVAEAEPKLDASEDARYREMARVAEEAAKETGQPGPASARVKVIAPEPAGQRRGARRGKKPSGRKEREAAREAARQADREASAAAAAAGKEVGGGKTITVNRGATVGELAELMNLPGNELVKRLMLGGEMLTVNQMMSDEAVELVADDLGFNVIIVSAEAEIEEELEVDDPADLVGRSPVVTVMGHVDHGKTSLLDAIRETGVAASEAGGITQHIGASVVEKNGKRITFIDTPGHEAFTAMRARGADITDVVILVVAADDGVMPQTVEAINHAKAAGVPIIVAVNKIDKDGANPERVRQELTEYALIPEEWGGDTIFVNVSAKKRIAIEDLLETVLLVAEVADLKANPSASARGAVIEGNLDRGRGPVATVLVQRGTLRVGDAVVAGTAHGRVRALVDPTGAMVDSAGPSDPVEILGLASVPSAGDEFKVMADERDARQLAEERALRQRLLAQRPKRHVTLDDLFERIQEGEIKDLNLVIKADVQGSIEALVDALDKMDQSEVRINVIHSGVGAINESDVMLADASDAIIIGFNVRPEPKARVEAERAKVDMRLYRVIYKIIEEINAARVGMLSPTIEEQDTGMTEVRELFKVPKLGTIAGSYVQEGEISRDDLVRVVRDGTIIYDGKLVSLRRFKDDVKSVKAGYECGVGIDGFQDLKVGDIIESYKKVEVAREA
jgi:translation initiation factor IF-2